MAILQKLSGVKNKRVPPTGGIPDMYSGCVTSVLFVMSNTIHEVRDGIGLHQRKILRGGSQVSRYRIP